jgi:hypothetical protein
MKFICPICKKLSERPDKIPDIVDENNEWQIMPICKVCYDKKEWQKKNQDNTSKK